MGQRHHPHPGARSEVGKHESFLAHKRFLWLILAVLICLAASASYLVLYVWAPTHPRPGGGTAYGYVLGTVSAALIVWLTAISIRKRWISDGDWSLKAWVSAHVYLGLSLLVLATLHTGFKLGWNIHSLAYVLMLVVIGSGIFGVVVYAILPAKLSENRGETSLKQMLEQLRSLDRQLDSAAQPLSRDAAAAVRLSLEKTVTAGGFWSRLLGAYPRDGNRRAIGTLAKLPRPSHAETGAAFDAVRDLLQRKAQVLARLRSHARLLAILEVWLKVHVPVTVALLAALTAHIVSVFFYW